MKDPWKNPYSFKTMDLWHDVLSSASWKPPHSLELALWLPASDSPLSGSPIHHNSCTKGFHKSSNNHSYWSMLCFKTKFQNKHQRSCILPPVKAGPTPPPWGIGSFSVHRRRPKAWPGLPSLPLPKWKTQLSAGSFYPATTPFLRDHCKSVFFPAGPLCSASL